ncbi:MAG: aminotransferase class I/II-fold pyridoxal phosphate-dependent enzyme [Gammaproteobacteria bacterium]|nr:aminotransferase class I/II-fold pyridoxal phosphate-dependent enzyme [Gammaproteobacteria bacterium]
MAFAEGIADFRSDTVTRPTAEMRRAMAEAKVGDDVYGEDPTVNALEQEAAAAVGKVAAVFTPTGSMANQLALNTLVRPGDEALCAASAHIRQYEVGAAAAISGVQFRTVDSRDGSILPEDVECAVAGAGYHLPRVRILVWENPLTSTGGTVVALETMRAATAAARRLGIPVHLDGARIFNAALALGVDAQSIAAEADTVMFCFSKGLGAPIGSVLCGSEDIIEEARFRRKRLGGGMRQVGIIAAAARVALRSRDHLEADHRLARRLGEEIASIFPSSVRMEQIQTNMVIIDSAGFPFDAGALIDSLAEAGVLVGEMSPGILRFATHRDVDDRDVDRVLEVLGTLAADSG